MHPNPKIREYGKQELEDLTARLVQLQTEWSEVNTKRNAWLVILGEDGDNGTEPTAAHEDDSATPAPAPNDDDITDVARQVISETGENGFKPRDITKKIFMRGRKVGSGFSSNLLFRMKKKGEVVEHNGRYYLPKFDPKPRLNMGVSA